MSEIKKVSDSEVVIQQIVMPNDTNPNNTIFGGVVMSWVDMAAAMVAERHSHKHVVTVHIDDISFLSPIKVGDHVSVKAQINYVGKSSMLIGCKVVAENPRTGDKRHTTSAYLTFVALNDVGRPTEIPGIQVETDEEKRRFKEGEARVKAQKSKRKSKK
ncbi:MAG: acyl-CoA thioesterase [Halobacteriovorax sp.]|nr:acyl-CoA thioesterase [Halobacteriovorax sp.]|tara:strand:- start:25287 stop:25763 length:477 start_codon:yes stop_codon:yes gene_type:complete